MAWLQLRVHSRHPEFADEILLAHNASAVSYVDAVDKPVLEPAPGETPLWEDTVTLGLFVENTDLAPVMADLRELLPDGAEALFETELIEDQDWVRVWLKDCPPLRFGDKLWVVPHEKVSEVTQADAVMLRLDPGLAFGTGTHPTTALCLEWIATADLRGKTVLDYGCGSGVLAIAALLMGAERAICVDIDPQALLATRNNAADNGVADRVTTLLPEAFVPFAADVVLANILANPLIALAPRLAGSIRKGGMLVLAGLLERHADEVRDAYATWFEFLPDVQREGWTRLTARCHMPALINQLRISAALFSAGQQQADHFSVLQRAGLDSVFNVSVNTSLYFLRDEANHCALNGIDYWHLPISWDAPQRTEVEAFFTRMDELRGRRTLVHCALNMRASALVFLYRCLRLGETVDVASQDLHAVWTPDGVWAQLIEQMLSDPSARSTTHG